MAIIAKWSGDGVANGTALTTTTGYASTDTHFDTVVITSPATLKVNDSPSLYTPRLELLGANGVAGGSNPVHWYWQAALGTGPFPQNAVRFYIELADYPTGKAQIFSLRDSVSAILYWLDVTETGIFRLRNNNGTALAVSALPLQMNQNLRIEATYNLGNVVVRVYRGDSIVPLEVMSGSGLDKDLNGNPLNAAQVRWGMPKDVAPLPHMFFDEMAFANTSDLIGPPWPSTPPFTVWDGSKEVPADLYGLWTGTNVQYIDSANVAP
jgi:hypothetical protein